MPNEIVEPATGGSNWQAKQVYAMAVISLVVGLAIGYLFRGSQSQAPAQPSANAQPTAPAGGMGGKMPSLEEMKQMAEKKAEPLLEKLKSDPTTKIFSFKSAISMKLRPFQGCCDLLWPGIAGRSKECCPAHPNGFVSVLRRRC